MKRLKRLGTGLKCFILLKHFNPVPKCFKFQMFQKQGGRKLKNIKNKKSFWILLISILILTIPLINKTFQNDTYFTIPTGNYILENGIDDVEPFTWHENLKFTISNRNFPTINNDDRHCFA